MTLTKSRLVAGFVGASVAMTVALSAASTAGAYTFTTTLRQGSRGTACLELQKVLNSNAATKVASSGAGSPGMETTLCGKLTIDAVVKFQQSKGISPTARQVGPATRAALNGVATNPTTPVVPGLPTGGALSVTAGAQPANMLAVKNATRVPFTKFVVSAGSSDVTINSVTVQRVGLLDNSAFSGVVLLDQNGMQIGIAKTLNSNDQAILGEPFVVRAGTSQTLTVAGNLSALSSQSGQVGGLNVVSVNTSASVAGSLPIMGAQHTMNNTLTIGTATGSSGPLNPSAANREIGVSNYIFSSVKIDAGSEEDIRLWGIRWNQSGSASSADLANVMVYVDGVAYPTTVSADGKYYSASFPGGILIGEGLSKEISIKGNIVSGTNRQVSFDIYKATDIYVTGETYKYGIGLSSGTNFTVTSTPVFNGSNVTIQAGTANTISSSNTVGAQNIAVLVSDQPLGAFEINLRGEAIDVSEMVFNIFASGNEVSDITNIKLVNQNGVVIAGPEDGVDTTDPSGTVTFNNVTLPAGQTTFRLVGRLNSGFISGDTIQASTTPSGWTTVTGQTTGDTIDLSSFTSPLTGALMTVRAGALSITASTQPSARAVIAGANGFEFARVILDAGQSGEDVRVTTLPMYMNVTTITGSQLSNCNLFEGSLNLTDGTNLTLSSGDDVNTFTFNNGGYVVPKGTVKTLSLQCNLASSATSGDVTWGIRSADFSSYTSATGVTSGLTIAESVSEHLGQTMTAATSGSYTVTADSSLLYGMAQAGTSGVTLAKFRFTAGASEAIDLKQIALVLGNTASNSPADLVNQRVTIWNGNQEVGYAQFGGSSADHATSSLKAGVTKMATIPAGESLVLTIKGDLSAQSILEGTPGAWVTVNYNGDNNGLNGNYATGVASQTTVSGGTTGAVSSEGVRVFRTIPTIAVTSNGGQLTAGGDLYKFTVTNPNSRDVVFQKFSFSLATSGGSTNGFILYGDGVAFNNSTSTSASETLLEIIATGTSNAQIVPANSTKTYILKASTAVDTASVSETVTLALLADTSYPSLPYLMGTVTSVEAGSGNTDNIIWSPFSTTTPVATAATQNNLDWTNGYGMPGFPSNAAFPVQVWTRAN